jgi:hypothetical protein
LDRRLCDLQSRAGCGGEEKNSQPLLGDSNPPIIQSVAQRYTTELETQKFPSSLSTVGYVLDDRDSIPGMDYKGIFFFIFATASRPALGLTHPPIQWEPGPLTLVLKRLGREADHSLPSSAEVKNAWSYTSIPLIPLNGVVHS